MNGKGFMLLLPHNANAGSVTKVLVLQRSGYLELKRYRYYVARADFGVLIV
jgi:hypothetical protein